MRSDLKSDLGLDLVFAEISSQTSVWFTIFGDFESNFGLFGFLFEFISRKPQVWFNLHVKLGLGSVWFEI